MAKIASDKLPVLLLFSHRGSIRLFFKDFCKERYSLVEVEDQNELADKLIHTKLSVVVLDERATSTMFSLCQNIQKNRLLNETPLFLISNELKRSIIKKFTHAGVTDFIREPLDQEALLACLTQWEKSKLIENKIGPLAKKIQPPSLAITPLKQKKIALPNQALTKIKETLEAKSSLSLVLVEIPIMKKVKNEWGLEPFLDLEKIIKNELSQFLRPQDFLIEAGEGKYGFILPSTSHEVAQILSQTLQEALKNKKFQIKKGKVTISLSLAIVTLKADQLQSQTAYDSLEKMLLTGEAYLEKAKKIGGRIVSN